MTLNGHQKAALYWSRRNRRTRARNPSIVSLTPATIAQGATEDITIAGTQLWEQSRVAVSGDGLTINSVTWVSNSELTVSITAAAGATLGDRDVTVSTPDGSSATAAASLEITT